MKAVKYLNEDDLVRKAVDILIQKLGPIETARFINIPQKRRIESVKRHRQWQKQLSKDKFYDEVFS
jgi:hypothetical protein